MRLLVRLALVTAVATSLYLSWSRGEFVHGIELVAAWFLGLGGGWMLARLGRHPPKPDSKFQGEYGRV